MEQKAFPQLVKAGVEQLVKAILEQLVKAKAVLEQLVDKQGEFKLDTMCQIISSLVLLYAYILTTLLSAFLRHQQHT